MWAEFTLAFIGGGGALAVVRFLFDYWKQRRERVEPANFLALEIAFLLEAYASDCAHAVMEHENASGSGSAVGQLMSHLPELAPYPESGAYRLLDKGVLHDVLEFPQRRHLADRGAMGVAVYIGDDDIFDETIGRSTVELGMRALDIAKRLRAAHSQPPRDFGFYDHWNLEEYLNDSAERYREREHLRQKASAEDDSIWDLEKAG